MIIDTSRPISQHPLNRGLCAWWYATPEFGNVLTTQVPDLCKNNPGIIKNSNLSSVWSREARTYNKYNLTFAVNPYYFGINNNEKFKLTAFTYSIYFKVNSTAGNKVLIAHRVSNASVTGFVLYLASATPNFLVSTNGTSYSIGLAGGTVAANTWYHIVITHCAGNTKLFLDGRQVASSATGGTISYPASAVLSIGADTNTNTLNGVLNDVRCYNRILNNNEVAGLHENVVHLGNRHLLQFCTRKRYFLPLISNTTIIRRPIFKSFIKSLNDRL